MCAIAGILDFAESGRYQTGAAYEQMLDTMGRRGPDQSGSLVDGPASLLHTRLCVVDIENGRQPMCGIWNGEEYSLVYNGELYNTQELRRELMLKGHRFHGHSDTEVLLHAYMQWGEQCVDRFNGIFAFAVWEHHRERLFIARDRIGVKPFFYLHRGNAFIFASEMKTLLAHPEVEAVIDQSAILEIMLIGPGRTPAYGVFRDILELQPGMCGYLTRDGLRLRRYWSLEDHEHEDDFEKTVARVRELVLDAIQRQLVSDVPVCTFLSGGLDSSIISAVADRHMRECGGRLHTFSVDYQENDRYFKASHFQPSGDNAYIRIMNHALSAIHHDVVLSHVEVARALYAAVDARDLPGMADVDSSLLLFCREIKKHATVALSGECADEIFGGYPWFRDCEIRERYGFPWAQSTAWRASFLKRDVLDGADPNAYVDERYRATLEETPVLPSRTREERRMKEMIYLNFKWFMQTLLDRKDRMSMYSGLEVRVPFCDYRIAEYLYAVPWEYKDYRNCEKGLLRQAMAGLLPEEVLWRKKSPYPKTHHPGYLEAVASELRDVLRDSSSPLLSIVDAAALERLFNSALSVPWYGQLMTIPQTIAYMLQVNYWMKKYRVRIV